MSELQTYTIKVFTPAKLTVIKKVRASSAYEAVQATVENSWWFMHRDSKTTLSVQVPS